MIEKVVLNYLKNNLDVPVLMEEPEKPPDEYVILEKTGGGTKGPLKTATMIMQSYGKTLESAAELNEKLKKIMEDIGDQDPISSAALNSDYNYTDTNTRRYRYQAVFDFIYYQEG
jgi:hypothetical protein